MLISSLYECGISHGEIISHSLPFLQETNKQINRMKLIRLGIDPDENYDESLGASHSNNNEVESTLPDSIFYGQLNALLK